MKNVVSIDELKPEARKVVVEICVRAMLRKLAKEKKEKAAATVGQ